MILTQKKINYELLWRFIKTDFKLRYYGSFLGFFWALLKPLFIFAVLYLVFTVFINWNILNYQLYLLLGIIIWNFFAEATINGINSLQNKSGLLKKVYFPRIFVVISSTTTSLLVFLLNILVFFLFYIFSDLSFSLVVFFFLPYAIILYFLALSISLSLSILQVYFKDLIQIWEILLQAFFYLTPIIYPISLVPEAYRHFLFLNPLTGIIQYFRLIIIEHKIPSVLGTFYLFLFVFLFFLISYYIFNKYSKKIIELL